MLRDVRHAFKGGLPGSACWQQRRRHLRLPLPLKNGIIRFGPRLSGECGRNLGNLKVRPGALRLIGEFALSDSPNEIFSKIYKHNVWGTSRNPDMPFFSGTGSHDPSIVSPYISAVSNFLQYFHLFEGRKPDVVDLGCGDFFVGSKIRPLCNKYIACDLVAPLIEFNKIYFKNVNVDFHVLDFTKDRLPTGDVVFIRQVIQHLSNDDIRAALPQITTNFRFLVLTEHLPIGDFVPNKDKPTGCDNRLAIGSGVILTAPPFNLRFKGGLQFPGAPEAGGVIRTNLYKIS
ncbi:MAG: class I SAM-dependent methyltransferase [Rhizomicrobium sp.]